MALTDLLYRCPRCGHDPLPGRGDEAACPSCGVRILRSDRQTHALVTLPGSEPAELDLSLLTAAIEALGGALPEGHPEGDRPIREARVWMQEAATEAPVSWSGDVLGFVEQFGERVEGVLRVTADRVTFQADSGDARVWHLDDLKALQMSSSKVQLRTSAVGLVQFRFHDDSARRWESLLRTLVAERWRRAGRGEIVEFQPRISTR